MDYIELDIWLSFLWFIYVGLLIFYMKLTHLAPKKKKKRLDETCGAKLNSNWNPIFTRPFLSSDRWLACSVLLTIIGGCRPLGTTSSIGCWISCKLGGCGCIGCKRNVGALGVCWPCTLASCNVVCMIEVVWWLTSMLMELTYLAQKFKNLD